MPRARARLLLATVLLLPGCRTAEPPARSRADTPGEARTETARAAAAAATCGVTSRYALGDSGVGALRVGAPLAAVRAACRVVRDTTGPGAEGMPERVALVDVGPAAVAATIVHDSVWRLSVTDSLLRTADSLGVGTPLGALRARAGWRALRGEGNLVVQLPGHCGLSFRLRPSPAAARAADADAAVRRLPAHTPVEEVYVVGCR